MYAVSLLGRDWSEDPQARRLADSPWGMGEERRRAAARRIALALHSFAARNPEVPLWAVWLPVDFATSEARARAALREDLLSGRPWEVSAPWEELGAAMPGLRVIDLRGALTAPAHFQVGDYHLSAEGHTIAAGVIVQHLQGAQ